MKYQDNEIQFWLSKYNSNLDKNEKEMANYCWQQMKDKIPKYMDVLKILLT